MRKLITALLGLAVLGLVAAPGAASASPTWQVTIHASSVNINLGQTLTFTGKVRPGSAAAGLRVRLQERDLSAKKWSVVATDVLDATGHYAMSHKPTANTLRHYRVVMPETADHARGFSPLTEVRVNTWTNLTTLPQAGPKRFYDSTVHLNGVRYLHSTSSYSTAPAHIEFNLNHRCTAFRATIGLSDRSEIDGQAQVTVLTDAGQLYTHEFALGQSESVVRQIDSPLKIRFEALSLNPGVQGFGAVGSPQVYCTR